MYHNRAIGVHGERLGGVDGQLAPAGDSEPAVWADGKYLGMDEAGRIRVHALVFR